MHKFIFGVAVAVGMAMSPAQAFEPANTECVAPASPGGGWDFTCRSVGKILHDLDQVPSPVKVTNMPGGGGGVAYGYVVGKRSDDNNLLVAASTATTSRLAQNQFAGLKADQVRWVAALGADFGAIAVAADSEYKSLDDLVSAMTADPRSVSFAGGSAVGGWDHLKVLLLAKEGGIDDVRRIKYVSFNNGGKAMTQVVGGHVDAFTGDISEIKGQLDAGNIRILAVLADERLPESLSELPTAKEQGYDVVGANWRGFYVPGDMSDAAYNYWVGAMDTLYESEQWDEAMVRNGLAPFHRSGEGFQTFVTEQIDDLESLSREIGLLK